MIAGVPARRPDLALVEATPDRAGRCVECGAPSGRRQRCDTHHARRAAELATARQRRRRAELKPSQPADLITLKEDADALTIELAALWARPELPDIEIYRPVLRSAAKLLEAFRENIKKADPT